MNLECANAEAEAIANLQPESVVKYSNTQTYVDSFGWVRREGHWVL